MKIISRYPFIAIFFKVPKPNVKPNLINSNNGEITEYWIGEDLKGVYVIRHSNYWGRVKNFLCFITDEETCVYTAIHNRLIQSVQENLYGKCYFSEILDLPGIKITCDNREFWKTVKEKYKKEFINKNLHYISEIVPFRYTQNYDKDIFINPSKEIIEESGDSTLFNSVDDVINCTIAFSIIVAIKAMKFNNEIINEMGISTSPYINLSKTPLK